MREIWLDPHCDKCRPTGLFHYTGISWCDSPVQDDCEECGRKPIRYVIDRRQI